MAKKPAKKDSKPESNPPEEARSERLKRFGDSGDEWKQTFRVEPGDIEGSQAT